VCRDADDHGGAGRGFAPQEVAEVVLEVGKQSMNAAWLPWQS
jgi:hypothetical protein